MTDMVGIASNAVAAYQRALGTVSNNIANVATDGYSRQTLALQANPVTKVGSLYMGTGVMVDRVQRQYDAFAEANLRNSNSDLASQEPMVSYANRVVDIMGGQTMGLTSALDQFFSTARNLSADPASSVARSSFVRDAQGLASRLGELSSQLDLVQEETAQAVTSNVNQMNSIIKQLAQVNSQLTANRTANAQPSALLDQRDQLLKDLSEFAHINTSFTENGTVQVSLGPTINKDIVVDGQKAYSVGATFDAAAPEKVTLMLDPYGKPSPLNGISSGSLAGLMTFREQVLGSTRSALDTLANTLVREINAVHQQGVDGYGNAAGALFTIDPAATSVAAGVKVAFEDPMRVAAAAQFRVIEGSNNVGGADASISYIEPPPPPQPGVTPTGTPPPGPAPLNVALVNNDHPSAARAVNVSASVPLAGIASVANGMQDVSIFLDDVQAGQQLQVLTRDGRQLIGSSMAADSTLQGQLLTTDNGFAAGATYSAAYLNVNGGTSAYKDMTVFYGAQAQVQQQPIYNSKDQVSGSKAFPALLQGGRLQASITGVGANALVLNDIALGALSDPATGTTLQAGAVANWINLKTAQTGVTATASNEIRLSQSQLKYGFPLSINGISIHPSSVTSMLSLANAITSETNVTARISSDGQQLVISSADGSDIKIAATGSEGSTAANALGITSGTFRGQVSLTKPASDFLTVAKAIIDFAKPLFINGQKISLTDVNSTLGLAEAINKTSGTNVTARVDATGQLILSNQAGSEGSDLMISATADPSATNWKKVSALGSFCQAPEKVYDQITKTDLWVVKPLKAKLNETPNTSSIQLGFGKDGTPSDLAKLGFRTGAYISGEAKDDLLVFVTGAGKASVSASYAGQPVNAKQSLRAQPMTVTFTDDTHYKITDNLTGTIVAERALVAGQLDPAISYQGLQLSLTSSPKSGDTFTLDGNSDGTGNNDNMLAIAALERKAVIGSKTLTNAYIDHVNEMGNIARQATIAKAALTVVHDQAITTHDQVSGVSLDQEAADLIRFQQAYQASAKILQVAGQLFDSILQVR